MNLAKTENWRNFLTYRGPDYRLVGKWTVTRVS